MQLTVIWPDGSVTYAGLGHIRGITRRDVYGNTMRPRFILADERLPPNVEQSPVLLAKMRRDLQQLGAFVPTSIDWRPVPVSVPVVLEGNEVNDSDVRDHFAAAAFSGFVARNGPGFEINSAALAYDAADALMRERERRRT